MRQLNAQANQLARTGCDRHGSGHRGRWSGLCVERSPELVVGLAWHPEGGREHTFRWIPGYPKAPLGLDAGGQPVPRSLLTQRRLVARSCSRRSAWGSPAVLGLGDGASDLGQRWRARSNPSPLGTADNLAYVDVHVGLDGKAQGGVCVPHRATVRTYGVKMQHRALSASGRTSRVLQKTFADRSMLRCGHVLRTVMALARGRTLVIGSARRPPLMPATELVDEVRAPARHHDRCTVVPLGAAGRSSTNRAFVTL